MARVISIPKTCGGTIMQTLYLKTYLEPCQTCKNDCFAKKVYSLQPSIFFEKLSILDVW